LDGKLKGIKWDGGIEKSRFSIFGGKKHDKAMLDTIKAEAKKGYVFSEEQKQAVRDARNRWGKYLEPIMPRH